MVPADLRIWLVEDAAMLRRNMAALIAERPGIQVPLSVATCEEMLAALDAGLRPDIVLMDIGLPGMSGIEGVRRLRSVAPSARVVILTVHEEDEKVFDAICAGASGYLLKPTTPEGILDAIEQVRRGGAPVNAFIARKMLTMFARLGPARDAAAEYDLSPREREVLQLLVDGLTMQQISDRLFISYHTVDAHLRRIYDKLHVHTRTSAVAKALRERLV